jgi:hypothetical protein
MSVQRARVLDGFGTSSVTLIEGSAFCITVAIESAADFAALLHRRYLRTVVNGGVGVPRDGDHQAARQLQG